MGDKSLMLLLPEVSYFVERIPIAKVVLKPSAVHLRFMQHARDSRMPLKKQCAALDIPWHARKVPANLVHKDVLKVARVLSASTFCQTMPSTAEGMERWRYAILRGHEQRLQPHAMRWLAHHGAELPFGQNNLFPYLSEIGSLAASTTIDVVKRRAEKKRDRDLGQFHRGGSVMLMIGPNNFSAQINRVQEWFASQAFGLSPEQLRLSSQDCSPVEYPDHLQGTQQHGDLTIKLCCTPEDFRQAGKELCNCLLWDHAVPFPRVDYFDEAKAGRLHIAIARRYGEAVAAFEFTPEWTLRTALGRRNANITDPEILIAAHAFADQAKATAETRGIDPTRVVVDEWQDSQDRQPRRDTLGEMVRRLWPPRGSL